MIPVNAEAVDLKQGFPDGASQPDPITVDTPGAEAALNCAREAPRPLGLALKDLDVEAWREEAIKKFGPEKTLDDGSKWDYVRVALLWCKDAEVEGDSLRIKMGKEYEGSEQQFAVTTFCPHL